MRTTLGVAKVWVVCAAAVLAVLSAQASPTLYTEDWNGAPGLGGGTENWQIDNGGGGAYIAWSGSYLQLTTGAGDPPVGILVYANSGSSGGAFVGNMGNGSDLNLTFSVAALNYAPSSMAIYFGSDSGQVWSYNIASVPAAGAGFQQYTLQMNNFSAWVLQTGVNGTAADFLADLSSVDWIGLHIVGSALSMDPQNFGLDDFILTVPEPETVALLLAVALSMLVTFRGKLSDLVVRLRA